MTTLNDLITSVYAITKRPDLVAETTLAIKRATLQEHRAIDYPRDLVLLAPVTLTQAAPNLYRYQLDLVSLGLYPLCRKIKIIREIDATPDKAWNTFEGYWGEIEFTEVAPDNIFDGYKRERSNYYYRVGNTLNMVATRQVENVAIYYYSDPVTTAEGYSSWIADMYDYAIYTAAAAEIFRIIGKDGEQRQQLANIQANRMDIIKAEIHALNPVN